MVGACESESELRIERENGGLGRRRVSLFGRLRGGEGFIRVLAANIFERGSSSRERVCGVRVRVRVSFSETEKAGEEGEGENENPRFYSSFFNQGFKLKVAIESDNERKQHLCLLKIVPGSNRIRFCDGKEFHREIFLPVYLSHGLGCK